MAVQVLGTGGTIAAVLSDDRLRMLPVAELCAGLADDHPAIEVRDLASVSSSTLRPEDLARIAKEVVAALRAGATGVVVTHGTDTLELSAFLTDLVLGADAQLGGVVFTGAMRFASHDDPDGPRNLRDAIRLAADPVARGWGALVCFGGEVHRASEVAKWDTWSLSPFRSDHGPLRRGPPFLLPAPPPRTWEADERIEPSVGLVKAFPGMTESVFEVLTDGMAAVVVEGFGVLNVPTNVIVAIDGAVRRGVAVVVTSRARTTGGLDQGPLRHRDLHAAGAIGSYGLPADKAWVALMAGMGRTDGTIEALRDWFELVGHYAGSGADGTL